MDKKIKEMVSVEYAKIYEADSKMHKYCVGKASDAVALDCGILFIFDKPRIEKNFCFGYRLSSQDSEEYDEANELAHDSKCDGGKYFKAQNLAQFVRFAEKLEEVAENPSNYFVIPSYSGNVNVCSHFEDACRYRYYYGKLPENARLLTANDVENLKQVNESERQKFKKRLNTYLNKYGTSKLRAWSYWVDA